MARKQCGRNREDGVREDRKRRMPEPIFEYRAITSLLSGSLYSYQSVNHTGNAASTKRESQPRESVPGRTNQSGHKQHAAEMHDRRRAESAYLSECTSSS